MESSIPGHFLASKPEPVKSLAEAFDLFRFLAATCELLQICLRAPEEKLALPRAEQFNQLANQLLYTFTIACDVLKTGNLHDALAVRYTSPVRFGRVSSTSYASLTKDVALAQVMVVEDYWREIHGGKIVHVTLNPQYAFATEQVVEIRKRFEFLTTFTFPGAPSEQLKTIRASFGELIVGLRQEQAWAAASGITLPSDAKRGSPGAEAEVARRHEDDREVHFPPPDSTPSCKRPGDELVHAAKVGVRMVLARIVGTGEDDAWRDGKGHTHIMACELVKRVSDLGHPANASEWAIHEMVGAGLLTTAQYKSPFGGYCLQYMKGDSVVTTERFWEGGIAEPGEKADETPAEPAIQSELTVDHLTKIAILQKESTGGAELADHLNLEPGNLKQRVRSQVFISYSHKDKQWLDDLQTHLKPYLRDGSMTAWSDQQIVTGSKWSSKIEAALALTSVAVLLVTPDFLESDFIHEHELTPILEKAERGGVRIVWIPVRACAFMKTPLKDYQAVIAPEKPLATMKKPNRDAAWVKICQEIEKAVKQE